VGINLTIKQMRGKLTQKEWDELIALEYVLTWNYSDDKEEDLKRYKYLNNKK